MSSGKKQNCWEFKACGRQSGGAREKELGVCPTAVAQKADGLHGGKNAGRVCWAIAGTMCSGRISGSFARKLPNCTACDFYKLVEKEEGHGFLSTTVILKRMKFSLD